MFHVEHPLQLKLLEKWNKAEVVGETGCQRAIGFLNQYNQVKLSQYSVIR